MNIRAELSSDTIARALGATVKSPSPVLALCRRLVTASTCASSAPLDLFRGEILALHVRSIGEGARLEIDGKGVGFRPLQAAPTVGAAPLVSYSVSSGSTIASSA